MTKNHSSNFIGFPSFFITFCIILLCGFWLLYNKTVFEAKIPIIDLEVIADPIGEIAINKLPVNFYYGNVANVLTKTPVIFATTANINLNADYSSPTEGIKDKYYYFGLAENKGNKAPRIYSAVNLFKSIFPAQLTIKTAACDPETLEILSEIGKKLNTKIYLEQESEDCFVQFIAETPQTVLDFYKLYYGIENAMEIL